MKLVVDNRGFAELLKASEKEGFVTLDRTAHGKAVIVPPGSRPGIAGRVASDVRVPRVEGFVHKILVRSPMELIGARPHRHIEDTSTHLAIFSSKVAGLNCDFLNRIHTGLALSWNAGRSRIGCVLTLHSPGLRVGRSAVEADDAIGYPARAGNHLHDGVWIPNAGASGQVASDPKYRKLIRSLDHIAHVAAFRPEQRSVGRNRDFVRIRSYLKGDIDTQCLSDLDRDSLPDILLKPRQLDRQLVDTGRQLRERVIACLGANRLKPRSIFGVRGDNACTWNHRVRLVGYGPGNGATVTLGKRD